MIKIVTRGIPEIRAFMRSIPLGVKQAGLRAIATYIMGDGKRGLRKYPPYKHVTRAQAYGMQKGGPGWFSDAQRKYVMARIREGSIDPGVPHRTGRYQTGWKMNADSIRATITNDVPHAEFVGGDKRQSRHEGLVGWQKFSVIISENMAGAIAAAQAEINRLLSK